MSEINHTTEIGLRVEIGHETITAKMTIEMSIRRKIVGISMSRDMREGLEITIKMLMTAMTKTEAGLVKDIVHMMQGRLLTD